jgi:hypothetical protein
MRVKFIWFFFLVPMLATGQPKIYVSVVAGTYLMSDMKDFQKQHASMGLLPLKIVSSFPPSLQAEAGFAYGLYDGEKTIGGYVNYAFTHGRMHYADYSGDLEYNLDLKRVGLGFRGTHRIAKGLSIYAKLGFSVTTLDLNGQTLLANGALSEDSETFDAYGLTFEPGLQWEYPYKRFTFYVNGGFEVSANGKTMYDDEAYLVDNSEDPVKIDWTGARLGVGIMFRLTKGTHEE